MRQPRRLRALKPRDRALKRGSRRRKAVPWRPIAKDISARRATFTTEQEARVAVTGGDGVRRGCAEAGRCRPLQSVFGPVVVSRIAYRAKGHANLCPADAEQVADGQRRR